MKLILLAMRQGTSTLYYLLTDHLGSTSITATSGGSWYSELRYHPWGGTRYEAGTTPTSYRYTGQREAEVGLYYYGARYYDPRWGGLFKRTRSYPIPGIPHLSIDMPTSKITLFDISTQADIEAIVLKKRLLQVMKRAKKTTSS